VSRSQSKAKKGGGGGDDEDEDEEEEEEEDDSEMWIVQQSEAKHGMVYVDLLSNPERFTGYVGQSPQRIWKAVHEENCFQEAGQCLEKRVFYRLLSGLQVGLSSWVLSVFSLCLSQYCFPCITTVQPHNLPPSPLPAPPPFIPIRCSNYQSLTINTTPRHPHHPPLNTLHCRY
jgi:hypothetical protein